MKKLLFFFGLLSATLFFGCNQDIPYNKEELSKIISVDRDFNSLVTLQMEMIAKRVEDVKSDKKNVSRTHFYESLGYQSELEFEAFLKAEYQPLLLKLLVRYDLLKLSSEEFISIWRKAKHDIREDIVFRNMPSCTSQYISCLDDAWVYYDDFTNDCIATYYQNNDLDIYLGCLNIGYNNYAIVRAINKNG